MPHFKKASDIKVGVLGYGPSYNMGRHHLQFVAAAGMTPYAVADQSAERRKVAEQEFPGIQTFASLEEMLHSEVDLVIIITPHNQHAGQVLQCLRAARHVVVEKPMAITTAECDRMIGEAARRNLVLSAFHNRHWDGGILRAVREIREKKAIGDIVNIDLFFTSYGAPVDTWRSSKTLSGGILYDWGVHLLEYSLQLIDSELLEVSAHASRGHWAQKLSWKDDSNEDKAQATLRFADGRWVNLTASQLDFNERPHMVHVTGTGGSYNFHPATTWECLKPGTGGQVVHRRGKNPPYQGQRYYDNIKNHLVEGEPLIITAEWSRRMVHILDLAEQSIRKGKAIRACHP